MQKIFPQCLYFSFYKAKL